MKLEQFLKCIDYNITDSSEFLWACYGLNIRVFDYWNNKHVNESVSIHAFFNTETQEVVEMQAWDGANNREYRWIHPDYIEKYKVEAKKRKVKWRQSIDEKKFIDLETEKDILEKSRAIFLGEEYDERIQLDINLTDEEEITLMRMAHEQDITLNNLIDKILRQQLELNKITS